MVLISCHSRLSARMLANVGGLWGWDEEWGWGWGRAGMGGGDGDGMDRLLFQEVR